MLRSCLIVCLGLQACAVRLDDPPDPAKPVPSPAVAAGCPLFGAAAGDGVLSSAASSSLLDGQTLWLTDSLVAEGSAHEPAAALAPSTPNPSQLCTATPELLGPLLSSTTPRARLPVDAASQGGVTWLSYVEQEPDPSEAFGVRTLGYGLAVGSVLRISALPAAWTADRPNFGIAVLIHDGWLYAYGCRPSGFLSGECLVARAAITSNDSLGSFEYHTGGGHWAPSVDDAWPIVEASTSIDVVHVAERERFWLLYVPVLGDVIWARSGLGPSGPWSAALPVARCALPANDPEAFCHGVRVHAATAAGRLTVSYAVGSFHRRPGLDYRTRAVSVVVPAELP